MSTQQHHHHHHHHHQASTPDDSSIRLRAYEIYREKGGSALDNWLEAERILKINQ